ncbi:MAG TPA: PHP domain-containing protein [Candidatus Acidoferrum sp.]|nr:PHP domain-containing protein [Candidatus Acidoferrum sp.]
MHTVLSPCAAVEMIPPLIVRHALELGLDLIAIADHNASANAGAVQRAAAGTGLTVLPGMELQTSEEVHLLCLFDSLEQVSDWQAEVDARMPRGDNTPEVFGEQFVVDETGELLRRETRLLAGSVRLGLEDAVREVRRRGGLAIPAHIDRPSNSLSASLGFLPPDLPVDAVEISAHTPPEAARARYPWLSGYPLVQGGDVHHLKDFADTTVLTLAAPTIGEIRLAFRGQDARTCRILPD